MSEIQKILLAVDSSMKMEGLPLSQSDKARIETCLTNPESAADILRALIGKHTAQTPVRSHARKV